MANSVQPGDAVSWAHYLTIYSGDTSRTVKRADDGVRGVVLDLCDPAFWAGTIAFHGKKPTRKAMMAHVRDLQKRGYLKETAPVRFETGRVALAPISDLVKVKADGSVKHKAKPDPKIKRAASEKKTAEKAAAKAAEKAAKAKAAKRAQPTLLEPNLEFHDDYAEDKWTEIEL